jgi:hypothetical protein
MRKAYCSDIYREGLRRATVKLLMIAGVTSKIKPGRLYHPKMLWQPVHAEFLFIGLWDKSLKVTVIFLLFTVLKLPLTG